MATKWPTIYICSNFLPCRISWFLSSNLFAILRVLAYHFLIHSPSNIRTMERLPSAKTQSEMKRYLYAIFLFKSNYFKSILIPYTIIGLLQASIGPLLTTAADPDVWAVLRRTYLVLSWNGLNLLTFNVTNQRLPPSVAEDSVNKPWRPIALALHSLWTYHSRRGKAAFTSTHSSHICGERALDRSRF